mmetsp:Transcript_42869/g.79946  ORF Transcript_42869/g.79946 Transcript_42869/m.79946 type:complete len:200 (-) Transcript_42869:13-612(-)
MGILGADGPDRDILRHGHPRFGMRHSDLHSGAGAARDRENSLAHLAAQLAMIRGLTLGAESLLLLRFALDHRDFAHQAILAGKGPIFRSEGAAILTLCQLLDTLLRHAVPESTKATDALVKRLYQHAGLVHKLHVRAGDAISLVAERGNGFDVPDLFGFLGAASDEDGICPEGQEHEARKQAHGASLHYGQIQACSAET